MPSVRGPAIIFVSPQIGVGGHTSCGCAVVEVRSVVARNKDIIMFSVDTWMLGLAGPGGTPGWY